MNEEDDFFSSYGPIFVAEFDDECMECGRWIFAGEEIRAGRDDYGPGHIHERCPGGE